MYIIVNIVHKGDNNTKPYYKYEPQNVLQNSNHKLYSDRSKTHTPTPPLIGLSINNRPYAAMFDKTTKEAYSTDVAIPNSHNLQSAVTQKHADPKEELTKIRQINPVYTVTFADIEGGT